MAALQMTAPTQALSADRYLRVPLHVHRDRFVQHSRRDQLGRTQGRYTTWASSYTDVDCPSGTSALRPANSVAGVQDPLA